MLANLFGKAASLAGGAASGIAGRLGGMGNVSNTARVGLAKGIGFAASHPTITGAGLGGIGGYATSGTVGGAFAGAVLGATGGTMGWNQYQEKINRKSGGLFAQLGRTRQRASASLGRRITKAAPGMSANYGPQVNKGGVLGWAGEGKIHWGAGSASGSNRMLTGHARNVGGKRLGAMAVGSGMMIGAGAIGGMGANMIGAAMGGAGNTFGAQMGAAYGNAFSGMGNGTVTGY
jgi:hypothetical protein